MHGIIFLALEEFIEEIFPEVNWEELEMSAGCVEAFSPDRFFDDALFDAMLDALCKLENASRDDLLEQFGEFLVPGLMEMASAMGVIKPEWRSMDVLENVKAIIHGSIRQQFPDFVPPDIRTLRLKHSEVAIAYISARRLCPLVRGVVRGLASHFVERLKIWEPPVADVSGRLCRINVFIDDPTLTRFVDVPREFELVRSRGEDIRFFNTVQGVPFEGVGRVVEFSEQELTVQAGRDLLSVMRREGKTHMSVGHMNVGMSANVHRVDNSRGMALLNGIRLADGAVGMRQEMRVEPALPVRAHFQIEGRKFQGVLVNISSSGASLEIPPDSKLGQEDLFLDLVMGCLLPLRNPPKSNKRGAQDQYFIADGNLLSVERRKKGWNIRVVFAHVEPHALQLVARFIEERREDVEPYLNSAI
ncbi:heme NO-binding domain-containing protein [Magnetofaba australis]|nr:heme NO-binding domain-containing protein [Magnetofaba australis]